MFGTDAIGVAGSWIRAGLCDVAIAGGADELHEVPTAGFWALGLAVSKLHRQRGVPLTRIVELFSAGPARVVGLKSRGSLQRGYHADVTIFDPKARWTYDVSKSRSLARNSPFHGWQLMGKVVATIVAGRVVYRA